MLNLNADSSRVLTGRLLARAWPANDCTCRRAVCMALSTTDPAENEAIDITDSRLPRGGRAPQNNPTRSRSTYQPIPAGE
jgi:hypothetical protein